MNNCLLMRVKSTHHIDEFPFNGKVTLMRCWFENESYHNYYDTVTIDKNIHKYIHPLCMNPTSGYCSKINDSILNYEFKKGDAFEINFNQFSKPTKIELFITI